jgi:hypothetical protein
MTWGNFGAVSGAQPTAVQPVGVQPFAPGIVGQPPGQAGATLPATFNSSFESVMAAVSRGEVSLNQVIAAGGAFTGNSAVAPQGNPTLMQAISQGQPQNGTNGLNGNPAGGGTVNSSYGSVNLAPGTFGPSGQTNVVNPKLPMGDPGVTAALANPIQYGGA